MIKHFPLSTFFLLLLFATLIVIAATNLYSQQPAITNLTAIPSVVTINTPSIITVTAGISDPSLIPGSVNLLRITNPGSQTTILGTLHDDGQNGDLLASDHIYTIQLSLNEPTIGTEYLQVSAAFRGKLQRILSDRSVLTVNGLLLDAVTSRSSLIIVGTVQGITSTFDQSAHSVFSYVSVAIQQTVHGTYAGSNAIVRFAGGDITTPNPVQEGVFTVGEVVLLLLSGPDSHGYFKLTFGPLSKFTILNDPVRGPLAVVDPGIASNDSLTPLDPSYETLLTRSQNSQLTLSELITALGSH